MSIDNTTIRIGQGATKTFDLATLNAKYSPGWNTDPDCPLAYVHRTINNSSTATVTSIVGTTLTLNAVSVNKLSVVASNWQAIHKVEVDIVNPVVSSFKAASTITVDVIPCAITPHPIALQTITVGDRIEWQFPISSFTWTHAEKDACG